MARDRVDVGLPSGRGSSVAACIALLAAWGLAASAAWSTASLFFGCALGFASNDLGSTWMRKLVRRLGFVFVLLAVAGEALAYAANRSQWFTLAAVAWGAFIATPWLFLWLDARSRTIRSEELVGLTVAEAKSRIGFDDDRAPHGLEEPTLVAVPAADVDLQSPSLIVTGVVVDDREGIMTFGVTEPDRLSADLDRDDLQRQLVDQVGGCPADILPLAKPDPLSKYRPRVM